MIDLGTGTGRVLELFADKVERAIGYDTNHSMLEYARSRLAGKGHEHCQVRQGDLVALGYEGDLADIVILHQVLHFLVEPEKALRAAARLLRPGGQMLVVDFAPHDLDFLRDEFAHERLGFDDKQIRHWLNRAGLVPRKFRQLAAEKNKNDQQLKVSLWLAKKEQLAKKQRSVDQGELAKG